MMANNIQKLKEKARDIRVETVKSLYAGQSGHPGSALSIMEFLTAFYFGGFLKHNPEKPDWEGRDYFLLSNGHAVPGLYATLAMAGYYPVEKLDGLRRFGDPMHGHPKRGTFPGVEVSSGSLGMGLSIGIGIALGLKMKGMDNKVFVMMSDGEQEEGSTWEALMYAPNHKLDNIVAIVDDNESQINGYTKDIMPNLDPLAPKYRAFGWEVMEIDGNDMGEVIDALEKSKKADGPIIIISNTIIGKGVSFMEGKYEWHHGVLDKEQYKKAMEDLKK
jgi:transketolase